MFTVRHLVLGFLLLLMSDAPKMGEVVAMRDGKLPQASEALRLDANSHSSMPGAHAALRAAPKAAKAPGHRYPKQVLTLLNRKRRSLHESKPSSGSTLGSHHASRPSNLLDSLKAAAGNKALPPVFRTRSSTPSIASASEILQPQDLLLVLPICVERLPLARAHRAYTQRLGMATVIVLNANEQQLELLNTEGLAYRETYMSYPDNPRILSHTAGDFRAAIAPALAYTAVPAGSFKWMLYGDDDTLFNLQALLSMLSSGWDHTLPYFISDAIMLKVCNDKGSCGKSYPNAAPFAPRCLPCHYQPSRIDKGKNTDMDTDSGGSGYAQQELHWGLPVGCPCTPATACKGTLSAFGIHMGTSKTGGTTFTVASGKRFSANIADGSKQLCSSAPYTGFKRARYFVHGGSGIVMSVGLFKHVPVLRNTTAFLESIQMIVNQSRSGGDRQIGGDGMLSNVLWTAGVAPTDPGIHYTYAGALHRKVQQHTFPITSRPMPTAFGGHVSSIEMWALALLTGRCTEHGQMRAVDAVASMHMHGSSGNKSASSVQHGFGLSDRDLKAASAAIANGSKLLQVLEDVESQVEAILMQKLVAAIPDPTPAPTSTPTTSPHVQTNGPAARHVASTASNYRLDAGSGKGRSQAVLGRRSITGSSGGESDGHEAAEAKESHVDPLVVTTWQASVMQRRLGGALRSAMREQTAALLLHVPQRASMHACVEGLALSGLSAHLRLRNTSAWSEVVVKHASSNGSSDSGFARGALGQAQLQADLQRAISVFAGGPGAFARSHEKASEEMTSNAQGSAAAGSSGDEQQASQWRARQERKWAASLMLAQQLVHTSALVLRAWEMVLTGRHG